QARPADRHEGMLAVLGHAHDHLVAIQLVLFEVEVAADDEMAILRGGARGGEQRTAEQWRALEAERDVIKGMIEKQAMEGGERERKKRIARGVGAGFAVKLAQARHGNLLTEASEPEACQLGQSPTGRRVAHLSPEVGREVVID